MFVNKDSFSDALYWYQKKIGSYDQPQWEKSVEERVLNGIHLNVTKRVDKLKNSLIDLDLIRGSAFNKTKPKQSWITTSYYGIIKVIFLPFYLNWWIEQTNRKICCILLALYLLQLCSMFIYFNNDKDPNVDDIPLSEVITPVFMFFFLGILYSQIFTSFGFSNRVKSHKTLLKTTAQSNNVNSKDKRSSEESVVNKDTDHLKEINNHQITNHVVDLKEPSIKVDSAKQQLKKNAQKYTNTSKLNKGRLKLKTCSTRTRSTSGRATKFNDQTNKRKRHLTNGSTNEILTTNQLSNLVEEQKLLISDDHLKPTGQSSNASSINLSHSNASINNLKQQLKELDPDESTSGEDCSPYSSISSSANLSKLLMRHKDENEDKKATCFTEEQAKYFEQHMFQPKKTSYFYFEEYKEIVNNEHENSKSPDFNDEQNDFKRKNNLNISDSESGSISPTTPMKSLNDWPMINSDNSTEDEDEEILLKVDDQKIEEDTITKQQQQSDSIENTVVDQSKRLNSLTNKSLNQDEIEVRTDSVDKISCTIYQQNDWIKMDLSMIDISSMIIKKVENVKYSNEYFYFAILFSLLFAFIPQIYRFQAICTSLNNTDFLQSSTLTNLVAEKLMNCDQNDLNVLDAYGIKKNSSEECKILKASTESSGEKQSTKLNKSAFVCGAINGSNSSEEFIEYLNYLPVLIFDLLIDVFKNSIYSFPMKFIVFVALIERFALSLLFFILLCVAERTYRERFLNAKYFCHLTSARRAKRNELPHFKLNKVQNIKTWLSIRSFLKKHGPQRSVDSIVSTSFILAVSLLTFLCIQLLRESEIFSENLYCYEMVIWNLAIGIFIMRLIILGSKMNRKYSSNLSVIVTEQINLYLQLEQKPHKKDKLQLANSVLKLAADLLKQLEEPFKISGFSANPYLYNITKVIVLSAFSAVLSEILGFKLKLYKIKIK